MKYDPTRHHRRSIRMKGYDYHNAGAYFVTICTKNRECVLDDPIISAIIHDVWYALPKWFPTIGLDEFVVMPNHTHFVVWNTVGTPLAGVLDGGHTNVGTPLAGVLDGDNADGDNADGDNADGDNADGDNADGDNADGDNADGDNADGGKPRPYVMPEPQKINTAPAWGMWSARSNRWFSRYIWIGPGSMTRRAAPNSGRRIIMNILSAMIAN